VIEKQASSIHNMGQVKSQLGISTQSGSIASYSETKNEQENGVLKVSGSNSNMELIRQYPYPRMLF